MSENREKNVATTIQFPLVTKADNDYAIGLSFAAGDVKISRDFGVFLNTINLPVEVTVARGIYTLSLTAAELDFDYITVAIIDQDVTKLWQDQTIQIDTVLYTKQASALASIDSIVAKLPSKAFLAGTANADGDIEMNDSTGDFNPTQIARINTEVDLALDTAIPVTPTTDSLNERIKAINDLTEAGGTGDLAEIKTLTTNIDTLTKAGGDGDLAAIKLLVDSLPVAVKKNVDFNNFLFFMVDEADHVTPKTGLLSITAEVSLDGGVFNPITASAVEISDGWYKIDLSAAETNGDIIGLNFSALGADARALGFPTNS